MSSTWQHIAQKWLDGEAERKEVVVEAVLEGQIAELETFLSANSEGNDFESKECLERDCCGYAYEYILEGSVEKAVQILSTLKDPADVVHWLKEVLWGTLDVSAREAVTNYLRASNQLTDEDSQMLDKVWNLLGLHPGASFAAALENCAMPEASKAKVLDAIQSEHPHLELTTDLSGVCVREGRQSLWEGPLLGRTQADMPEGKGPSFPYMRMTGDWLNDISTESLETLRLEGGTFAGKGLKKIKDDEQWKPAFLYYLSHHMVEELLNMVESVPAACIAKDELKVYDGEGEVISFGVDSLDVNLDAASALVLHLLEVSFLSRGIWLKTTYSNVESFLTVTAQAGFLLATTTIPFGLLPLLQGIPFAKLVVKYCAVNGLPHILQKYLDMHKLSSDMDTTKELLQSAGEVQWVHWLILSRVPSQAFATTIANARAVLPEAKFESLTDLANKGSAHMLLSAIADQPGRLAEVMTSDAPASNEAPARDLQSNGPKASLCNIEPSCTLEALETSLKPYPTLLSSLQGVKMLEEYKGKATKQEYLKWRERIFGVEGINLVDLIPNKEGSDFRKLLKMCASCPGAENGNGSWSQEVSNWEQETIVDLHEWLGMITAHEAGNGSALGVCHHLLSGHPLAALKWYLVSKEDQIGENLELQNLDQFLCLPNQDIIFLERLTRLVALQNWQAPTVVSACMVMACVCGISVTPMKVDATVLQKLGDKQDCDVHSLAADLLKEVQSGQKGGAASIALLELLEEVCSSDTGQASRAEYQLPTRRTESSIDSLDSIYHEKFEANQEIMMQWSLVHAFASVHGLHPSSTLLEELAKSNDWILFLAESGSHEYPPEQVLRIARTKFTDTCLGHHVCHILNGHRQLKPSIEDTRGEGVAMDIPEKPKSRELFEILVEAERTGLPGQALLKWSGTLKWQLLTVIGACCTDAPMINCLVAWLDIFAESNRDPSSLDVDPERSISVVDKLAWHVHSFCRQRRFEGLMEAFRLFHVVPKVILSHFLEGLKMFAEHMLPAAEAHFKLFQESMNKNDAQDVQAGRSVDASTPSGRSTMTSSPSMRGLDPVVEADLTNRICQTSALTVLRGLPSSFEKEQLLRMLTDMEISDCCTWPSSLRILMLAYKLLGADAEQYVVWSGDGASARPSISCPVEVLHKLERERKWIEAREWGLSNDLNLHEITKREAEALVQEWEELGLGVDLHEMLWEEVDEILREHSYPPILAGIFFLQQCVSLREKNTNEENQALLLRSLSWVKEDTSSGSSGSGASKLVADIRRSLFLINGDSQELLKTYTKDSVSTGGRYSRSPAVQMVLKPAAGHSSHASSDLRNPTVLSPLKSDAKSSPLQDFGGNEEILETGHELLRQLVERPSQQLLDKTVKLLLDLGEVEDAKKLGNDLPFHPINSFLVDTAMAIIHTCGASGWSGESVEGIAMGSILNFLRGRKFIGVEPAPAPQQVLDAVALACMDTGGYSVCSRAAVTYKASTILNSSCENLAALGPHKILEELLSKGEGALDVARQFGAAFELTARSTARLLAQIMLKELLEAHSATVAGTSSSGLVVRKSSCTELMGNAIIGNNWVDLGNALMEILLERHSALPCEVEADILAMAYQCYERCEYVEGLDVLLELAGSRIEEYASQEMYEALVKLITGLNKYENMQEPLDLLVQNDQLERLLNAAGERSRTSRALRSAILCSVHRHQLGDCEGLALVHEYFSMHADVAKGLKNQANKLLEVFASQNYPARHPNLLHAIDMLMRASEEYALVDCSLAAAQCWALVALVAQQVCFPERNWVCLKDNSARSLLAEVSDHSPALVLARAYQFNTPQDWILTLWQHIVEMASGEKRAVFGGSIASILAGIHMYSRAVWKEIVIEDHLEQVTQMFMYFRDKDASYGRNMNKGLLSRCFSEFIRSIPDHKLRLHVCESIGGPEFEPLVEECITVLDLNHTLVD